jgi:hypothetical protein
MALDEDLAFLAATRADVFFEADNGSKAVAYLRLQRAEREARKELAGQVYAGELLQHWAALFEEFRQRYPVNWD